MLPFEEGDSAVSETDKSMSDGSFDGAGPFGDAIAPGNFTLSSD